MFRVTPVNDNEFRNFASKARRIPALALVGTALLASGCASFQKDHFTVGSVPSDYRTNHPIVVQQDEVSEELIVNRGMGKMSQRHRNQAFAFLARFKSSGASHVQLNLPAGSHNESAARLVAQDVIQLMKDERLEANQIKVTRYHAANHGDAATIQMSFMTTVAAVESECGQWKEDLVYTPENKNYGNFGCATQNNLAEMIANPQDLVGPRGESEIDAERRSNVIDTWRQDGTANLPGLL